MEDKLTQEVQKVIENEFENRLAEPDSLLESFQKASEDFENLKKRGLVKNRGYNLLTIDEAHLHRMQFNIANHL